MEINYQKGDATQPQGDGLKILIHVCNDIGGWGKGFVMALSKRWKAPKNAYRDWYESKEDFEMGSVQFVKVADDIVVGNMIGQKGIYKDKSGEPPIRYDAIRVNLQKVADYALAHNAIVHAPRFGPGLAGGKWEIIESLIQEELIAKGVAVTIYDFG
jgi:hypothetical protein